MFDFHFAYSDGNTYDVRGVTKIVFKTVSGIQELSGDDILTARIPLGLICLYSQTGNVTVSGTNLIVVDVLKRDD